MKLHEWRTRTGIVRRVYTNVSGSRLETREEPVPDWQQCVRCGCSRGAVERFGWECDMGENEREEVKS